MSTAEVFDHIYSTSDWGHQSGPGANPRNAAPWISLVNSYLKHDDIKTILDVGCGDGQLIPHYYLDNKEYLGIDVSVEAIKLIEASDNIRTLVGDITTIEIPKVDLIIIKDVLQHLPNDHVQAIVPKLIENSKRVLICNDYAEVNTDTFIGGHRGLDLNAEPFEFGLKRSLNFVSYVHFKSVFEYEKLP